MDKEYTLQLAQMDDLPSWMALVTLVRYNFPLLELDEELDKYKQIVIKNIIWLYILLTEEGVLRLR